MVGEEAWAKEDKAAKSAIHKKIASDQNKDPYGKRVAEIKKELADLNEGRGHVRIVEGKIAAKLPSGRDGR